MYVHLCSYTLLRGTLYFLSVLVVLFVNCVFVVFFSHFSLECLQIPPLRSSSEILSCISPICSLTFLAPALACARSSFEILFVHLFSDDVNKEIWRAMLDSVHRNLAACASALSLATLVSLILLNCFLSRSTRSCFQLLFAGAAFLAGAASVVFLAVAST